MFPCRVSRDQVCVPVSILDSSTLVVVVEQRSRQASSVAHVTRGQPDCIPIFILFIRTPLESLVSLDSFEKSTGTQHSSSARRQSDTRAGDIDVLAIAPTYDEINGYIALYKFLFAGTTRLNTYFTHTYMHI